MQITTSQELLVGYYEHLVMFVCTCIGKGDAIGRLATALDNNSDVRGWAQLQGTVLTQTCKAGRNMIRQTERFMDDEGIDYTPIERRSLPYLTMALRSEMPVEYHAVEPTPTSYDEIEDPVERIDTISFDYRRDQSRAEVFTKWVLSQVPEHGWQATREGQYLGQLCESIMGAIRWSFSCTSGVIASTHSWDQKTILAPTIWDTCTALELARPLKPEHQHLIIDVGSTMMEDRIQ